MKSWRAAGLLRHRVYNDKGQCLFEPPGNDVQFPTKGRRKGISDQKRARKITTNLTEEV